MKDAHEILQIVIDSIHHFYKRPAMYASSPEALNDLLSQFRVLWSEIVDCENEYFFTWEDFCIQQGSGAMSFVIYYRQTHCNRDVSDAEVFAHVVAHWQEFDKRIGLHFPSD